jgi:hypothetical protein
MEERERLTTGDAAAHSSSSSSSSPPARASPASPPPGGFSAALRGLHRHLHTGRHLGYVLSFFEEAVGVAMKFVGPGLIMLATGLISGVMYWGVRFIVPMYGAPGSLAWCLHSAMALFLGGNMLFNYAMCVCTNAGSTDSAFYRKLVGQARATGALPHRPEDDVAFLDPEYYAEHGRGAGTPAGVAGAAGAEAGVCGAAVGASGGGGGNRVTGAAAAGGETLLSPASADSDIRKRNADTAASHQSKLKPQKSKGGWMNRGPYEWMYCHRTHAPKAPRAHYDHVTGQQVLNMDHYCPWMFNPVGYLNYRYFWLFLMWTWLGCLYCVFMTVIPFSAINRHRPLWGITVPRHSRSSVSFIFVITTSVGCAVSLLFFWHVYLLLTAQTTIEFHGNRSRARKMRTRGEIYKNAYDLGRWRNWCQVMGTGNPVLAVLPSTRGPPGPVPWPSFRQNAFDRPRFSKSTV